MHVTSSPCAREDRVDPACTCWCEQNRGLTFSEPEALGAESVHRLHVLNPALDIKFARPHEARAVIIELFILHLKDKAQRRLHGFCEDERSE